MDDLHYFGFDPSNFSQLDSTLLGFGILFSILSVIVPGIVAYFTWRMRSAPSIIREIRTGAEDLTPGERAFVEHEFRERELRRRQRERRRQRKAA